MVGVFAARLRWRIAVAYAVLTALALLAPGGYVGVTARQEALHQIEADMAARAWRLAGEMRAALDRSGPDGVAALAAAQGDASSMRITLIDTQGEVLGDSQSDPQRMDNHGNRPEVQAALSGRLAETLRHSATLDRDLLYLAAPVARGAELLGVVRVALTVQQVSDLINQVAIRVAAAVIVAMLAAVAAAIVLAQIAVRSLRPALALAQRLTAGDLTSTATPASTDEAERLVGALQRLAANVRIQLAALEVQRAQSSRILQHFADGVVVLDAQRTVVLANPTAERLLEGPAGPLLDRTLTAEMAEDGHPLRVIAELAAELERNAALGEATEATRFQILQMGGRWLEIAGTPLPDGEGFRVLALVRDITPLRHAEAVRTEFVAGVTPELAMRVKEVRGRISRIAGAGEGEMDTPANRRLLAQVGGELDRLTIMVTEMLERARRQPGAS